MNKDVSIYKLRDRILMHPNQITSAGIWLATPEYVVLGLDSSAQKIGNAVFIALENSGNTIPHPISWTGLSKPRLDAAGVKSEAAFHKSTRLVSVIKNLTQIEIKPSRNGGTKGDERGFHYLSNATIHLACHASATEIGQAILSAFALCVDDT